MASTTKTSSTADVRAWAKDNKLEVGARGRISGSVIAAFNKANPRKKFAVA